MTIFLDDVEKLINSAILSLRQAKQETVEMKLFLLKENSNNNLTANVNETTKSALTTTKTKQKTLVEALDLALVSSGLLHNPFDEVIEDRSINNHNQNTTDDTHTN